MNRRMNWRKYDLYRICGDDFTTWLQSMATWCLQELWHIYIVVMLATIG